MRDHMMGWPAAMLAFEPEQKKQYITPTRSIRNLSDEWETKDFSYIIGQKKKEEKKPEDIPTKPAGAWVKTADREPDADGWIAHTPGPCPVAGGRIVSIKLASGVVKTSECIPGADGWRSGWITHYRVVK